jgi:hypothetical protein
MLSAFYYSNLDMDNQIDELFENKALLKDASTQANSPLTKKEYDACITAINGNVKKFVNAKKKLAALKSKVEELNGQEITDDIKNKIDAFNSNYEKIGDAVLHNSLIIRETIDKLDGFEPEVSVREIYDNNNDIVGSIVCILGFLIALILMPSLKTSLIIWSLYCIFDDLGWIIVFYRNKQALKI